MFFCLVFTTTVHKWFYVFLYIFLSIRMVTKYPAFEQFQFDAVVAKGIFELHLIVLSIPFQFGTDLCQAWLSNRRKQVFWVLICFLCVQR